MGRTIAIANQKGGVGKTTTAINLSACLAKAGRRVLLLDLDPQGNATSGLGQSARNELSHTVYDLLLNGASIEDVSLATPVDNLTLVPSNRQLVGAEVELVDTERREYRLREALANVRGDYDWIFMDCPPSLGLLTVNGLVAADGILITLQCEYYALEGLSELLNTICRLRDSLNPGLYLEGVLMTMHQNTRLAQEVVNDARTYLNDKVYQTVIPRNVRLSEAPGYGKPIIEYDINSAGAKAYLALAKEITGHG